MANTPKTETIVLAAGETKTVNVEGRQVTILSCTAASFEAAFDRDVFSTFYPGCSYPCRVEFDRVRFRDSIGAGCTIIAKFDDVPGGDAGAYSSSAVLVAISATLTTIAGYLLNLWNRLSGAAAATVKADTNVAATGGAGTLLFAASATRKLVEVQALQTNSGYVYIGNDATVSATNKRAILGPGDSWYDDTYTGAVYAVGSDAAQWICGNEE